VRNPLGEGGGDSIVRSRQVTSATSLFADSSTTRATFAKAAHDELHLLFRRGKLVADWNQSFSVLVEKEVDAVSYLYPSFAFWARVTNTKVFVFLQSIASVWTIICAIVWFYPCPSDTSDNSLANQVLSLIMIVYTVLLWFIGVIGGRILLPVNHTKLKDKGIHGYMELLNAQLKYVAELHGDEIESKELSEKRKSTSSNGVGIGVDVDVDANEEEEKQKSSSKQLNQMNVAFSSQRKETWLTKYLLFIVPPIFIICVFIISIVDQTYGAAITGLVMSEIGPCAQDRFYPYFIQVSGYGLAIIVSDSMNCISSCVVAHSLWRGSQLCSDMIGAWTDRYKVIQRLTEDQWHALLVEDREAVSHDEDRLMTMAELRTDAYERYLLIQHFLSSTSFLWDYFFLFYILGFFGLFIFFASLLFSSSFSAIPLIFFYELFAVIFLFFPIGIMAYANYAVVDLVNEFLYSAPASGEFNALPLWLSPNKLPLDEEAAKSIFARPRGHFSLVGGRKEWLVFLTQAPLYWNLMGLPITPRLLQTAVGGFATTLALTLLPRISQGTNL